VVEIETLENHHKWMDEVDVAAEQETVVVAVLVGDEDARAGSSLEQVVVENAVHAFSNENSPSQVRQTRRRIRDCLGCAHESSFQSLDLENAAIECTRFRTLLTSFERCDLNMKNVTVTIFAAKINQRVDSFLQLRIQMSKSRASWSMKTKTRGTK
jgi:hypothetical protein